MRTTVVNNIIRIEGGERFSVDDVQIAECPVTLTANGADLTSAVITETDGESKELWALGYLKCGGLIDGIDDVIGMSVGEGRVAAELNLKKRGRARVREPLSVTWRTRAETIAGSVQRLGDAPLFKATGGVHAAAIFEPDGRMLFEAEDIGRHNAVDKAVGWALRERVDLSGVMLATSGRMPADMVMKAWSAGIPLMASISAATADGAAAARMANMSLVGFVRGARMNIYTDPGRIQGA